MDVLYYIGNGSRHQNRELRYSLRSLEKHCKDVDNVWIVGNHPPFISGVKYYWIEDSGQWWQNAFYKTKAAIEAGISDDFLLMNDDFYMLADFTAAKYPHFHRGDIKDTPQTPYQQAILNTRRILEGMGKPFKHYGVHCPMRINGKKYLELERFYTGDFYGVPVSARCLYGNLYCKGKQVSDCKSNNIKESVTGCYSSKDWAKDALKELQKMFPEPCKWELDDE